MLLQDTQAELQRLPAGYCSGTSGQVKWSTARSTDMNTDSSEWNGLSTRKYQSPPNCGVTAGPEASVLLEAAASRLSHWRWEPRAQLLSAGAEEAAAAFPQNFPRPNFHIFSSTKTAESILILKCHNCTREKNAFNLPILFHRSDCPEGHLSKSPEASEKGKLMFSECLTKPKEEKLTLGH